MDKRIKENRAPKKKLSKNPKNFSTENKLCFWTFRNIDRVGKFAFNPNRQDFNAKEFLIKLLDYSSMTWYEIKRQTHDDGKSKNHELNSDVLSKYAAERIRAKRLEDDIDAIFSFALNNKVRVIGIRNGAEFQVCWYDPKHEFAPSSLKHT